MKELRLLQILLGVLFIGLKLGEVITWSWWLVLLPFYGSLVLFIVICFVGFSLIKIGTWIEKEKK